MIQKNNKKMDQKVSKGKSNRKGIDVLNDIRDGIVRGRWKPGEQLDTQRSLAAELGATLITVQRALDQLRRDGFVVSMGSQGTFVCDRPPHLANLALVFEDKIMGTDENFWSLFHQAMYDVVGSGLGVNYRIRIFDDINAHIDNASYMQLLDEIKCHRLRGMIFAASPHHFDATPLMSLPDIARVVVGGKSVYSATPAIYPDRQDFIRQSVAHLAEKGRKRPALLMAGTDMRSPFDGATQESVATFKQCAAQAGMTVEPWWIQGMGVKGLGWTTQLVHLMLNDQQVKRPDSLIIADDTLVEAATAGVLAAGLAGPCDFDVVAYTNFPLITRTLVPVYRIGFDIRQLLLKSIDLIVRQSTQRPKQKASLTLLPAIHQDQYQAV
ncbi:MAG: hypothetical protein CMJ19_19365 [Phycisphaeraceae bacterium]|nr:hypothetical protein [Phycisphaeraceae bacterium]